MIDGVGWFLEGEFYKNWNHAGGYSLGRLPYTEAKLLKICSVGIFSNKQKTIVNREIHESTMAFF